MCCRCPPFPTGTLTICLLLNVLFLAIELTGGLYMVGPVNVHVESIEKCENFEEKDIELQYYIDEVDTSVTGNITVKFDFDETVEMNFRDKPFLPNEPLIKYINQRSFCKAANSYLYETPYPKPFHDDIEEVCPIEQGKYYINGLKLNFALSQIPREMLGSKRYQFDLVKDEKMILCLDLKINMTPKNLSEYDQYRNIYKEDQSMI